MGLKGLRWVGLGFLARGRMRRQGLGRGSPECGNFFHWLCLWAAPLGLEGWEGVVKGLLGVWGGLGAEFGKGFPCLKGVFLSQCRWVTPLGLDD